jgi:hypothetical protein
MRLLDPRFNYVPAAATDVTATWKRFGFDPKANAERRAGLRRVAVVTREAGSETAQIHELAKMKA